MNRVLLFVLCCLAFSGFSGFSQDLEAMMKLSKLKRSYRVALEQGDLSQAYSQFIAGRSAEKALGATSQSTFDSRQLNDFADFKMAQATRWLMVDEAKTIALVELMRLQGLETLPAGKQARTSLAAAKEKDARTYQKAQEMFDRGSSNRSTSQE